LTEINTFAANLWIAMVVSVCACVYVCREIRWEYTWTVVDACSYGQGVQARSGASFICVWVGPETRGGIHVCPNGRSISLMVVTKSLFSCHVFCVLWDSFFT
jgi:hypothetical protein